MYGAPDFHLVFVGNSTQPVGWQWDYGRLDKATAEAKALRLAREQPEPVFVLKSTHRFQQIS
jgi:hypothetical protein